MTDTFEVDVRRDEPNSKYDAWLGDRLAGVVVYEGSDGGRLLITHAAVLPEFQHHGVGGRLISRTLQDIRDRGAKVTIVCPVVRDFIDRHPEWEDVVDPDEPGVPSKAPDARTAT
ncbi:GNAT family N-acetyltransferase [Leifsonia sp. NPDC058248]|uniref:GNAT family N-acetyltransferase n=1 Tax=Leifsonia sp. NPDC058248 TaxID=3346402 RepID=UPI0036DB3D3A